MESRIVKLKAEFNNIISIRNTVKNVFDILQVRIDKLKLFYSEFIKNSKNDMFVFGLDSFRFQSKLIDIEYDDMKRLFLAINNRMYCEYFKLHKIIVEYILNSIDDKKITDIVKVNNYPVYKDLEPYKDYKFETTLDIHENILNLLNILMASLDNKENELAIHKTKQRIGLNIDNFITTFTFNIVVLREKIMMFITYIEFFHKMHTKYLQRFSNKIQLMHSHVNHDIKFDENVDRTEGEVSPSINKNEKTPILEPFFNTSLNSDFNGDSDKESSITLDSHSSVLHEDNEIYSSDRRPSTPSSYSSSNNVVVTNIQSRIRTDSSSESKRSFKQMIKNNVTKVSNMFQVCKPKNSQIIEHKASNDDIVNMFSNIDTTCNTIIRQEIDENVGFMIDEVKEMKEFMSENSNINNVTNVENFNIDAFINHNEFNEVVVENEVAVENAVSDLVNNVVEESIVEEKLVEESIVEEQIIQSLQEEVNIIVEEVTANAVEQVNSIVEEINADKEPINETVEEQTNEPSEEINDEASVHGSSTSADTENTTKKKRKYKQRAKK